MKKENKIHLEWAKVYWPQDYEVVDELKKLKEENKKLKEEIESLKLHIEAKDEAYMKLLKDYEELKNCGRYVFDCSKYDFTWLTSTTPQLEVSKKSDSGDVFTK